MLLSTSNARKNRMSRRCSSSAVLFVHSMTVKEQSPYRVSAWLCIFLCFFFLIKILQILVSASLLDFYINLNIVFFNREVVPRFLRIIFLGHTTRHTKFDCTVEILPSKFVPQMNCLRKWTNWLAKTYLQTSKGMNLLLAASIFVNVWNSSNRSYLWSQLFLYQTFDRKQHFFYILLQINKRNKANLQRNLKLCRWDARSSAFAWCNQKYMFLRLVDYEKMLDKYFHVFYTNVIFVICLSLIYCKRFLCRVFIPFSPSECADFLTWYYQLGQEVVSHDGFQYRSQWNSKPSLFQPLWGGGGGGLSKATSLPETGRSLTVVNRQRSYGEN